MSLPPPVACGGNYLGRSWVNEAGLWPPCDRVEAFHPLVIFSRDRHIVTIEASFLVLTNSTSSPTLKVSVGAYTVPQMLLRRSLTSSEASSSFSSPAHIFVSAGPDSCINAKMLRILSLCGGYGNSHCRVRRRFGCRKFPACLAPSIHHGCFLMNTHNTHKSRPKHIRSVPLRFLPRLGTRGLTSASNGPNDPNSILGKRICLHVTRCLQFRHFKAVFLGPHFLQDFKIHSIGGMIALCFFLRRYPSLGRRILFLSPLPLPR